MSFMGFFEVELKSNPAILPLILLNVVYLINIEKSMENMFQITIYENCGALIWLLMGFDGHLVETLGTTPKQNLTES